MTRGRHKRARDESLSSESRSRHASRSRSPEDFREEEIRHREGEQPLLFTPEPRRERAPPRNANTEWQDKISRAIGKDRPVTEAMREKWAKQRERRIYITSLKVPVSEEELRAVFQSFGEIKQVYIPPREDEKKRTTYALMDFATLEAAQTAVQAMNNFRFKGQRIQVAHASPAMGHHASREAQKDEGPKRVSVSKRAATPSTGLFGVATYQQFATRAESEDLANPLSGSKVVKVTNLPEGFSEAEVKQVFDVFGSITTLDHFPHRREAYIHFFEKSHANTAVATMHGFDVGGNTLHVTLDARNGDAPSTLIVLKNLMEVAELDDDVKDEIYQECLKHGKVVEVRVHVVASTQEVRAFALYQLPEQANRAVRVLNERSFAKRKVKCELYDMAAYSQRRYEL
ncbi:RNA recognition motif-containing protein [Toxoplasma gondii VEG]|uniref:RNA recognition motif-containing protein n=6 Tax=Toxoplasma gondii TaxID=5811 RepID=B9QQJ6_TOXGV|nr:RNA recognition motif-containing protein [Toxoplasma gondii VEG]KFG28058.1 RNA recognition motif-containing protein [Toxoplasma gondii p89]CEL71807.1 TPA: RNA recognition motif-containing protein [Toxoplasma gondii VEG]